MQVWNRMLHEQAIDKIKGYTQKKFSNKHLKIIFDSLVKYYKEIKK